MSTFVIHLYRLNEDIRKLSEQLKYHKEKLEKRIINFNFDKLIEEIEVFPFEFDRLLRDFSAGQIENIDVNQFQQTITTPIDIYGNTFKPTYRYAEVSYDNIARFTKIRLLGVDGAFKKRFYLENLPNEFSFFTTIRLIENIREIVKSPLSLNLEELLTCKRDAWKKDSEILSGATLPKYRYTWDELVKNYFSPKPIYDNEGKMSEAEIQEMISRYDAKSIKNKEELERELREIDERRREIGEKAEQDATQEGTGTYFEHLSTQIKKSIKESTELLKSEAQASGDAAAEVITPYLDKFSIGCLLQEAINCLKPPNFSCRDLFRNLPPSEIFDRLSIVFPKSSDTFKQIEVQIENIVLGEEIVKLRREIHALKERIREDKFLLQDLEIEFRKIDEQTEPFASKSLLTSIETLKNSIENHQQNLIIKENLLNDNIDLKKGELRLSDRLAQELKFGGGNITAIFSAPQEGEEESFRTISERILYAIELVIPLEELCEAIFNALSFSQQFPFINFEGLPSFSFPQPKPPFDIFEGISIKIGSVFSRILAQALIAFIDGIITDLINCNQLDNFIAKAINSSSQGAPFQPLKELYNSKDKINNIVENNYDNFISNISTKSNSIISATYNDGRTINIGLAEQDVKNFSDGITLDELKRATERTNASILVQSSDFTSTMLFEQAQKNEKNWDINSTGDRFEIISDIGLIDLQEIDRFFADIGRQRLANLSNQDKYGIRSFADASGIEISPPGTIQNSLSQEPNESTVLGKPVLTEEETNEIKEEMKCIMQRIVSIISPTQVLKLFAGTASSETVNLAQQIVALCSSNLSFLFQSPAAVANMFNSFGSIAGLSNLIKDIELLSKNPDFEQDTRDVRCGPYSNIEDFREDLMRQVLTDEQAKNILDKYNEMRLARLQEMISNIQNPSNLNNFLNINQEIIGPIIDALGGASDQGSATSNTQAPITTVDQIQNLVESEFSLSPVIQDMLRVTLDSIFMPMIRQFNQDISGLSDAISEVVEVEEPITRTITVNSKNGKQKVINPQFKDLLNNNLVPILQSKDGKKSGDKYAKMVERDSLKSFTVLKDIPVVSDLVNDDMKNLFSIIQDDEEKGIYISGESSKNFLTEGLNKVPLRPVLKKVNKKIYGQSIKDGLDNLQTTLQINDNLFKIGIDGTLELTDLKILENVNFDLNSLGIDTTLLTSVLTSSKASWKIIYQQKILNDTREETKISLESEGFVYTESNGKEDFFIPKFSFKNTGFIPEYSKELLRQKYDNTSKTKKRVFDDILFENIIPLLYSRGSSQFEQDIKNNSLPIYNKIIKEFFDLSIKGVLSTPLLSQRNNSAPLIQSLNFAKKCEHILDTQKMRQEFAEIFSLIPDKPTTKEQRMGLAPRHSKLGEAASIMFSKIILKVICFDFVIKSLPSFYYYKFSDNIIQTEMMLNVVCEFVTKELKRLNIEDSTYFYIKKYFDYKNIKEQISELEIEQYSQSGLPYPFELRYLINEQYSIILSRTKEILEIPSENSLIGDDQFIKFVLEQVSLYDVHMDIGLEQENREDIYSDLDGSDFILERYLKIPQVNENSSIVINRRDYFTAEKIKELNNIGIISLREAQKLFTDLYYELGEETELYRCTPGTNNQTTSDIQNSMFKEEIKYGLRLVYADRLNSVTGPVYKTITGGNYPFLVEKCQYLKSGYIKEKVKEYHCYIISQEEIKLNETVKISTFSQLNHENRYMSEFYQRLKSSVVNSLNTKLLLNYSVPLKEVSCALILHNAMASNNLKMKYLFEPTKKFTKNVSRILNKVGDKKSTSYDLEQLIQAQMRERENVGNPAGPIDFDAFKLYLRTPIQLLRGIATVVDPNIAITDKVVMGISMAMSLAGIKLPVPIPYSLVSLALLPFPIFTPPPAGIIPPLTSYNITMPVGPIFLALEPLLWDLPYYQNLFNEIRTGKDSEKDDGSIDEDC